MNFFLQKKLKINFLVFFTLQLHISICFSDVLNSTDYLPISEKMDVWEFGINRHPFYNDFAGPENQNFNFKNSGINFGYKIYKNSSSLNLKIMQNQNKSIKYSDNNKNNYLKLSLDYGMENKRFFNIDWKSKIKFIINGIYNQKVECFETNKFVFGGSPKRL